MIFFYNSIYFSKLIWLKNFFTQIFIYFSKPFRLLYSLIIYEIVNFFFLRSLLFATSFFLSISEKCSYTRDCSCKYFAEHYIFAEHPMFSMQLLQSCGLFCSQWTQTLAAFQGALWSQSGGRISWRVAAVPSRTPPSGVQSAN